MHCIGHMQILGIRHRFDKAFPKVIAYLSQKNWKGKTIAIEDYDGKAFDLETRRFWKEVRKIVEGNGGEIALVENEQLMKRQAHIQKRYEKTGLNKYRKQERLLNLDRTVYMVRKAYEQGADLLMMGIAHAFDIQKILGKKANVKIIAFPPQMIRKKYYLDSLNEMKRKQPQKMKQISQLLDSYIAK